MTTTDTMEGVIIPAEGGPSELVLLQRDPESVFLDEPFLKALLAQITARATDFTPDISTDKGRKQIASMAFRVSQTKTYLDGIGKDLVAELKERPRRIDAGRKLLRDGLDALRDHVRQALNEWEAEQARQQIALDGIRRMPADHTGSNADQLRQVIQRLEGQESTIPGAQEARDEERLRQELRIPAPRERDERIAFTIDVPPPLGNLVPSYNTIRFSITMEALARAAAAEMERGIHDGIAQRCLHLEEEVQRLSSPSVQAILQEVERARAKYPERDLESRFRGFAQEFGEALQAIVKMMMKPKFERPHEFQRAREEVIQAAGQAIRMLEEAL